MNEQNNPFSIIFGKEPGQIIARDQIKEDIISDFTAQQPSMQVILLTGVRGSGKSAFTASLMKDFSNKKDWYVVDLLVEGDMLLSLADKLSALPGLRSAFSDAKVSFSALGISAEMSGERKNLAVEAELDKMLQALKKHKKRLLITIDDVASIPTMKTFAHFYQSCLMKNYDVFLVMNGVYDNIENLQNQKTLTFLQRSPKIKLEPFSKRAVFDLYAEVFNYPEKSLKYMASLTAGYPYAVQVLGYLVWKSGNKKDFDDNKLIQSYDNMLAEGVYNKLWTDMSEKNQKIALILAESPEQELLTSEMIRKLNNNKQTVTNYKKRLIQKGILSDVTGKFIFALPRFKEFVIAERDYE